MNEACSHLQTEDFKACICKIGGPEMSSSLICHMRFCFIKYAVQLIHKEHIIFIHMLLKLLP